MRIALLLLLSTFSIQAWAGIYVEPGLGYELGKFAQTLAIPGSPTASSNNNERGGTYSIGAGVRKMMFFAGGQYEKALGNAVTDIGATVGVRIPFLRFWMSYIFSSKDAVGKGTGYKVGIGTSLAHFLSLNAEYIVRNNNTYIGSVTTSGLTYSGKLTTYRISVSFPLYL